jgi:3-deoxy-7-phosphoheptulonate synthase
VIIILRSGVSDAQINHVIDRIEELGLQAHLSRGTYRTIVGVIGDETKANIETLRAISGVHEVMPILPPYKLASKEAHPQPSIVEVGPVKIGGGHLAMIAGPCAVEEPERMDAIASAVRASGANIFRGGAYKPRRAPTRSKGKAKKASKSFAKPATNMECRSSRK